MKFADIDNERDLLDYLQSCLKNKQNSLNKKPKYFYHYTKDSTIIDILKSNKWYMGSPLDMNDGLEKIYLLDNKIDNIFFASFLTDEDENLGMWSMYSQPWSNGVIIKIPIASVKKWIALNPKVYAADKNTKQPIKEINDYKLLTNSVVYVDMSNEITNGIRGIKCGNQLNYKMIPLTPSKFGGYIKDKAWSYEREIRVRIETQQKYDGVCMEIPSKILNTFEFVTGPRYTGNLLARIRKVDPKFNGERIIPSLFTGRLSWVYCDSCVKNK